MTDQEKNEDFLEGFTLTPGWVKNPTPQRSYEDYRDDGRENRPQRHDRDGGKRGGPRRFDSNSGDRRARPQQPHGDFRHNSARPASSGKPPFQRLVSQDSGTQDRGFQRPFHREHVEYPVEIRILPDQKALATLVRKVVKDHRAFPVRDLAKLMIATPTSCEIRIDKKADAAHPVELFQCKKCGWVATDEQSLIAHTLSKHFSEVYDSEEIEVEAPTGAFVCVAKCGVTGKLLAPPNHHSFNTKVQEMLRTDCAGMSEVEYRSHIEMLHDADAIEKWREEAKKAVVYSKKHFEPKKEKKSEDPKPAANTESAPEETAAAEPDVSVEKLSRISAEAAFLADEYPMMMSHPKSATCTFAIGEALPGILGDAVRTAVTREKRNLFSLSLALRGAFRNKKLHVFRAGAGDGIDFVMASVPAEIDVEHAVPALKKIIDFITVHPGCTRSELLAGLGVNKESETVPEQAEIINQLTWITGRGHVIEFTNGVLALPEKRPFFRVPEHPAKTDEARPKAANKSKVADEQKTDKPEVKAQEPVVSTENESTTNSEQSPSIPSA